MKRLALCLLLAYSASAEEVVLYGRNGYSQNQFLSNGNSMVSTDPKTGQISIRFSNRWSAAVLQEIPLPNGVFGKLVFSAEYRMPDPSSAKKVVKHGFRLLNRFDESIPLDKSKHPAPLPYSSEWRKMHEEIPVPKDLHKASYIFINNENALLELRDAKLVLSGMDPSSAAIRGVAYPFGRPGIGKAGAAKADFAEVEVFPEVPDGFDEMFWKKIPEYRIVPTALEKRKSINGDHQASFRISSDGKAIFVYFQALDDILNFDGENIYSNDCFEFFLMPGGRMQESRLGHEQYTISRTASGETLVKNATGETRLVDGGWEAIMRIPLKNDDRKITPFDGLELTFNAIYQDADAVPQEHYLSYSSLDQANRSFADPSVYVPLVFRVGFQTDYTPFVLPSSQAYDVEPKFPGRINLYAPPPRLDTIGFWRYPTAELSIRDEAYTLKYPEGKNVKPTILTLPGFPVLAGETLEATYEARVDRGTIPAPGLGFHSFSNWKGSTFRIDGTVTRKWKKFSGTAVMADYLRENMRSGFLFLGSWSNYDWEGRTLQIRNIRICRRLPVDFDALIQVPDVYADFPDDNEPDELVFIFDTPTDRKAVISVGVFDGFSDEEILSLKKTLHLKKGRQTLEWDVTELPRGFFNVILDAKTPDGAFLAHREIYVTKSLRTGVVNPHAGTWGNAFSMAPRRYGELAEFLKSIGIGTYYISDWNMVEHDQSPLDFNPDLEFAKALKKHGMTVCSVIYQYNPMQGRQVYPQAEGFRKLAEAQFRNSGDVVDYWNFVNEPNLNGGWRPIPCAQEWALMYRIFYSAAKRLQPRAKVVFGNLNDMPIEFLRDANMENGRAFSDGIIGVHLYGIDVNGNAFESLLANREKYEEMYPGWEVWDTESGLVYHTFRKLQELQTKRLPIEMCAGVLRHFFYNTFDLNHPYGDSTPLVPAEAFKNRFLDGLVPVGKAIFGDVHLYAFQRPAGTGAAVFWNTRPDPLEKDIPALSSATHFDQYGNPLPVIPKSGRIEFPDRFVHYAENVDLDKIAASPRFRAAFRSRHAEPVMDRVSTEIYAIPDPLTQNTHYELAPGIARKFSVLYCNDSGKTVTLVPTAKAPTGIEIVSEKAFQLETGQSKTVSFEMVSGKMFKHGQLAVGGTIADESTQLVPVVFELESAPPVTLEGYTRSIIVGNNTDRTLDPEITFSASPFVFIPEKTRITALKPGERRTIPIRMEIKQKADPDTLPCRPTEYYTMRMHLNGEDISAVGKGFFFKALAPYAEKTAVPLATSNGDFQAEYRMFRERDGLRILATVQDATPNQNGREGALRTGGDCFVVAVETTSGKYREYGFAPLPDGFTSYEWDGTYGLENTQSATECVGQIVREKDAIHYDVTIPFDRETTAGAACSLLFIDRNMDGHDTVIEVGGGILKRNSAYMGVFVE